LWSNPSNWSTNSLPTSSSDIVFLDRPVELDIDFTLSGTITAYRNSLIINSGKTFTNNGEITYTTGVPPERIINNGVFINNGGVVDSPTGQYPSFHENNNDFTNNGDLSGNTLIKNAGIFTNSATGTMLNGLENSASGQFDNFGTFNVRTTQSQNSGTINNKAGADLIIGSCCSLINDGSINNFGTITNVGTTTNNGDICGGTIIGNSVMGNTPTAQC